MLHFIKKLVVLLDGITFCWTGLLCGMTSPVFVPGHGYLYPLSFTQQDHIVAISGLSKPTVLLCYHSALEYRLIDGPEECWLFFEQYCVPHTLTNKILEVQSIECNGDNKPCLYVVTYYHNDTQLCGTTYARRKKNRERYYPPKRHPIMGAGDFEDYLDDFLEAIQPLQGIYCQMDCEK